MRLQTNKTAMGKPNVCKAFQRLGLVFDITTQSYRLAFNEQKQWESSGLRELWLIDFLMDQLSTR
jgi:hypothetical protein